MNKDTYYTENDVYTSSTKKRESGEEYIFDKSPYMFYWSDEYSEALNILEEINNLELPKLEKLISHYRDKLNKHFMRRMFSSPITEEEKEEDSKNSFGCLLVLDYLKRVQGRKFNELDRSQQILYLTHLKQQARR